jgi:alpha-glucosidase
MITPVLDTLPVYVRGGAILPIAPLVQSTNEIPKGALTLRVYSGPNCSGDLYQDDGKSFAFRTGAYLRLHFTCQVNPDGTLAVHIDAQQGSFVPWWKEVRIETFGWTPKRRLAIAEQGTFTMEQSGSAWAIRIPFHASATNIVLQ